MQKQYGIIGYPLSHSFSPAYFARKFAAAHIDASYDAYPLASVNDVKELIQTHPKLRGLNVTIPYKQQVIPYLDTLDTDAAKVGAVNCIAIDNGVCKGYNTDIIGFERSLRPLLKTYHTYALVLGTGGASLAITYVLDKLGIPYLKVSREPVDGSIGYDAVTAALITSHTLIINTTPLGMYPDIDAHPELPYTSLTGKHLLYDLIYNPEETQFLALGKQHGAVTKNGYEMLVLQAEASWDIWNR